MKASTIIWKIIRLYEGKIKFIVLVFLHRLKGIFVSLYFHVTCFTHRCVVSFFLAVFTLFILILCGAVVGIQWLSCFHFLRLHVTIFILAFHHHLVVFRRIVRMWLYYVKLVGREFRMYKLVFEVLVALVWDKWSLGP